MNREITISAIESFKVAWIGGMEQLLKASKIYTDAIDKDEKAKDVFREAFPKMSSAAWARIEAVGRGQMHYLLLCDSSPAAEKIRKLPYSEQKLIIDVGCEVLTEKGDVLKVKHENLTAELTRQVIAKDHIRDISEQRAFRESNKIIAKTEAEKPADLWKVKGKCLHIFAPTVFNRQQLINILQDIG